MYSLIVKAHTMIELKNKLQDAADAIGESEDGTDLGYEPKGSSFPSQLPPETEEAIDTAVEQTYQPQPPHDFPVSASPELDARGIPWNEAIHASSKSKNKDGSWRVKRGVDDATVAKYEASIRGAASQIAPAAPMPTAPVASQPPPLNMIPPPPAPTIAVQQPNFQQPPVPQPVAATPAPAPVAAPQPIAQPQYENIPVPDQAQKPAHSLDTFKSNLVPVLSQLITAGKLTPEYVEQLKAHFQVDEIWKVTKDEAKTKSLFDYFAANGLITKVG